MQWLPPGKEAAVCFTIDDIHPGKSTDYYEAGGDLEKGSLGIVKKLLDKHPKLKVTLFTTADWREISSVPTRKLLAGIPGLRDHFYLANRYPKGTMQIDRHRDFIDFLNSQEQMEVALHGLYHCHKGLKIPVEFQQQSAAEFDRIITEMLRIFNASGVKYVKGICPPGWNAPDALLDVLVAHKIGFVASARDIKTPISASAATDMSGMKGMPLIFPAFVESKKLVHIPSNFQATSKPERATEIIRCGGLVSIKAHIVKSAFGLVALDGVDEEYMNYLDRLLTGIEKEWGDAIWWTSMGEISARMHQST